MRRRLLACAIAWSIILSPCLPGAVATAADADVLRAAERSAAALLQRMDDALAQQSYDGVFTYMRGETVSSLRLMHTVIDGVQHERLVHLDGTPREILRVGERLVVILQRGDELAEIADDIPAGPLARTFVRSYRRVSPQYRVVLGNVGRVAGRAAQMVGIVPVDNERYGHQLWLDEATGMLLKSQLVAADGTPLEVFQCAQISLGRPIPQREFVVAEEVGRNVYALTVAPAPAAAAQRRSASIGWRIGWLPRGFAMSAQTVRAAAGGQGLQTLFYGDGLAALSVFIEPVPAGTGLPANLQVMREGATVAVSVIARDGDGRTHLVTVVGEVPVATATRVARSVLPRG